MRTESVRSTRSEREGQLPSLEAAISTVLRWSVVLSAAIILFGIALFVAQAGPQAILFAPRGIPPEAYRDPSSVGAVLHAMIPPQPAAVADLGLLILIVTPVVSVAVAAVFFAVERDWTYVGFAVFVLAMLLVGFVLGQT